MAERSGVATRAGAPLFVFLSTPQCEGSVALAVLSSAVRSQWVGRRAGGSGSAQTSGVVQRHDTCGAGMVLQQRGDAFAPSAGGGLAASATCSSCARLRNKKKQQRRKLKAEENGNTCKGQETVHEQVSKYQRAVPENDDIGKDRTFGPIFIVILQRHRRVDVIGEPLFMNNLTI